MDGLGVAASVIAVVDVSAKVALLCTQYFKDVKAARKDIDRLKSATTSLKTVSESVQDLLDGPNGARLKASQSLRKALGESLSQLQDLEQKLSPSTGREAMRKFGLRALKWPFKSKDVDQAIQEVRSYTQTISFALQVDQTVNTLDHHQKAVLSRLPIADGASYDSYAEEHNPTCYEGTRAELLHQISDWAEGTEAKAVLWLNGVAGTGKSTISRTVAKSFSEKNQLGASFFFKRGEGDRGGASKFFTTIAAQLIQREPALAPHVQSTIDADPGIFGKRMLTQFEELIWKPWSQITQDDRNITKLSIVIDALDECEREEDVRTIIDILSRTQSLQAPRLRVFVTSRPELPIRLGFHNIEGKYQDVILHQISREVVGRDISAFLRHELGEIRNDYNKTASDGDQLPSNWPGQGEIQVLVNMAIPLFIFAATVCRFIKDPVWHPNEQLKKVLAYETETSDSEFDPLDATYRPALDQLFFGKTVRAKESLTREFRNVVGSIILLAQPLSALSLAKLLGIRPEIVNHRLSTLHSVLNVPPNQDVPIRLFHKSFHDFLLDVNRRDSNQFWVDEKETHRLLATNCVRVLNSTLQTDICGIQWPGTLLSSVDSRTISDKLRPEVQYACRYWAYHTEQAGEIVDDNGQTYVFLKQHFLHWLEALSFMGRASESFQMVKTLQSLLQGDCTQLRKFLDDALRFIPTNLSIIQRAPLQIYCSALVFAPEKSIIRTIFKNDIPEWICNTPKAEEYWSPCLQTLEGHSNWVRSVAFSPDSKLIASGSGDKTIRLWSMDTGESLHILEGHESRVSLVAFSADSKRITSISDDCTVRIWSTDAGDLLRTLNCFSTDSAKANSMAFSVDHELIAFGHDNGMVRLFSFDTGELLQTLKDLGHYPHLLAFSPDSKLIAVVYGDDLAQLRSVDTAKLQQTLEGHLDAVRSIAFSPDSKLIAVAYGDGLAQLWSVDTAKLQQTLKNLGDDPLALAFSPDSKLIAVGHDDGLVQLWSVTTVKLQQTLEGHLNSVDSIAFSSNSKLVASASSDATIRLWLADTGQLLQTLQGHTQLFSSIAFSANSKFIVSGSGDDTVRLWSAEINESKQTFDGHSDAIDSLAISADSKLVASGSRDETVRLWSVATGELQQTLEGHTDLVVSVAFSPDSNIVASGSADKTVRLWSIATGELQRTLEGHTGWVESIAFSPDSNIVASGSGDKTVRLWSVATGKLQRTLDGHTNSVVSVAFSPDSNIVASISYDGTVQLWSANTGELRQTLEFYEGDPDFNLSSAFITFYLNSMLALFRYGERVWLWSADTNEWSQVHDLGEVSRLVDYNDRITLADDGSISKSLLSPSRPATVSTSTSSSNPTTSDHGRSFQSGYSIDQFGDWIRFNERNLLWVPVELRPETSAVAGSTVVLGSSGGKVTIFRFFTDRLLELLPISRLEGNSV
ncbi:vegetative incompatibility protein HET-E-1 [Hypoxylon sp. NC1633]|nr:vegetative incompatibility protein HET-E-1 [Hypoxylon sp. NC1633]